MERVILAGGCFWGMQSLLDCTTGVVSTRVGYTGGGTPQASYETVKTGRTGHAEAVEVVFDPSVVEFRELLDRFFQIHDPTTRHRQGNDVGSQYRSAIFTTTAEQAEVATHTIAEANAAGVWPGPIVTEIVPAGDFWEAEAVHQHYLRRNPGGYTCHFRRPHWTVR